MTKYLAIYDPSKIYLFPNMTQATPEKVAMDYTAVNLFTCVFETDASETVIYTAPEPIQVFRSRYDIASSLSDEEALTAIEEILNTPEEVNSEATAEERIAAALEYQNLVSMDDATTV